MTEDIFADYRDFLKDTVRQRIDFRLTDQSRGVPPPPVQKSYPTDGIRIDLEPKAQLVSRNGPDLISVIEKRRSHRHFRDAPLTLADLAFLLWATQGIRKTRDKTAVFRTVPSAGCRHALETYLCSLHVEGLDTGIYRYLPVEHQLLLVSRNSHLADDLVTSTFYQSFIGKAPVTFVWTAIPYRMEWRYHLAAHKVIAIDAGHVCQNLYLASAAVGAGTCAVAAYHQQMMDRLIGIDGTDEFVIYLAAVGKI